MIAMEPGTYKTQDEDGVYRTYDEHRAWLAGKKTAKDDVEKRLMDALASHRAITKRTLELFAGMLGDKFGQHRKAVPELIEKAMKGFGKAAAEAVNKRFAEAVEGMKAELFDRVEAEIAAAVKDLRSVHEGIHRRVEQLAQKAADRATAELRTEVRELRKELAELKAGQSNVRVLR